MKVAIVCGAPSSEHMAPQTEDWEVWCLGNRIENQQGKRVTRIFEIHDDITDKKPGYAQWLAKIGVPLIVGEKFPVKGEHIRVFPFDEVEKLWDGGDDRRLYLSSTPAYMIAMALLEGATELAIYGCDMAVDDAEYFWQRPCVEAWIGFAKGMGVKVTIPEVSPVLKSKYIEGRDYKAKSSHAPYSQDDFQAVADMHQEKMDGITAEIDRLNLVFHVHKGARDAYQRMVLVARAVEGGQDIKQLTDTVVLK